jgi:hypothetical protein
MLRINRLEHRVTVVPFAASDALGSVEFRVQFGDAAQTAAAVRLEDVIPPGVGLVKMDIEGAEPAALRVMGRILSQEKPRLFIKAPDDEMVRRVLAEIAPHGCQPTGKVWNATPTYEFTAA